MSCCDNKDNDCCQGRDCELHDALAEQRVNKINEWFLNNYSLISNGGIIVVAVLAAIIWLTK